MHRPLVLLLCLFLSLPAHAGVERARESFAEGRVAVEAGDDAKAFEAFTTATESAPTWLLPYLELGELSVRRRERVKETRASLAKVREEGRGNPRYHRLRGDLAELDGDGAGAVEAWEASLKILPRQEDVRLRRASALERLEKFEEAVKEYERLLESSPYDLVVRARLAQAAEKAGDLSGAHEQLMILVEMQPKSEAALRRVARFLERRGQWEDAKRLHQQADRLGRRGPERKLRPLPPSRR